MGIGMGYAIAAAVESGAPVVAIEGDSAFGFSGMELETICRYRLPIVVIILNNGGVYRGDGVNPVSADPSPTTLMPQARHDRLIEAFGGKGYQATTPAQLTIALTGALLVGRSSAHRLRDRPRRRHRKRPPHPPQPDRRRAEITPRSHSRRKEPIMTNLPPDRNQGHRLHRRPGRPGLHPDARLVRRRRAEGRAAPPAAT